MRKEIMAISAYGMCSKRDMVCLNRYRSGGCVIATCEGRM